MKVHENTRQWWTALLIYGVFAFLFTISWYTFTQSRENSGQNNIRRLPSHRTPYTNATNALKALKLVMHLHEREKKVFSQNGEDGIIEMLMGFIGPKSKYYVEFGTETCSECNTRYLREKKEGWKGLLMDGGYENVDINLHRENIRYDNIVELFHKYHVPHTFDLLSVDTDFKDYWILKAILEANYRPRLIVSEVNTFLGWEKAISVPHDSPQDFWDGHTQYFGYSPAAAWKLAREYNYSLLYCDRVGVNCFYIIDGEEGFGAGFRISDFLLPQHIYKPTLLTHLPDFENRPYVSV